MIIGLYTNKYKDKGYKRTREVANFLFKAGFTVFTDSPIKNKNVPTLKALDMLDKIDTLISIGGDGTLLSVADHLAKRGIKVLAINEGDVGFLTDIEKSDDIAKALQALINNTFTIEKRKMLDISLYKIGEICKNNKSLNSGECEQFLGSYLALNEAVIAKYKASYEKIIRLSVYADEHLVDTYHADGFMVSTPTGSTAYSLSAGGPILEPFVDLLLLVAINAHSLRSKPVIVNDARKITILIEDQKDVCLIHDGKKSKSYFNKAVIKVSNHTLDFIKIDNTNFFDKLKTKLQKWSTQY
ncbi:MAG: NAD(+)/NADH kinase [Firmicutes bacterium]|nr:NAD(+)/NADH kinase [Bacillota bacterium]